MVRIRAAPALPALSLAEGSGVEGTVRERWVLRQHQRLLVRGIISRREVNVFPEKSLGKSNAIRVRRLSLAEARANLNKIAKHAHVNGDYFFVGGNGAPLIGIMAAEEMEDYLELRDPSVQEKIQKSNEDIRAGLTRPAAQLLEEARRQLRRQSPSRRRQKK